jgi:hypothetical protein
MTELMVAHHHLDAMSKPLAAGVADIPIMAVVVVALGVLVQMAELLP